MSILLDLRIRNKARMSVIMCNESPVNHEEFMLEALDLARMAASEGEVPVGAIVVRNGEVVGRGYNKRESSKNALAHAEIMAINEACNRLGGWRLHECDLYVTLEPCPMCAGAIINSRIRTVYYGAKDEKSGSLESLVKMFDLGYNHKPAVVSGILEDECSRVLSDFFFELRKKKRKFDIKSE